LKPEEKSKVPVSDPKKIKEIQKTSTCRTQKQKKNKKILIKKET